MLHVLENTNVKINKIKKSMQINYSFLLGPCTPLIQRLKPNHFLKSLLPLFCARSVITFIIYYTISSNTINFEFSNQW